MLEIGVIEHAGRGKCVLAHGLYEATGKPGVHTRPAGLCCETNKEVLVKHIQASGVKSATLKELQQVLQGT
ncbi:MAG: hypothetical protein LBU32_02920 [Clostridiales bacterium]|nr:hypothetical protein [Clostridiales bacterium]